MKYFSRMMSIVFVGFGLASCSSPIFSSGAKGNKGSSDTQPTTPTTGTPTTPVTPPGTPPGQPSKTCTKVEKKVGSRVALLIDNSGSNSETDCEGRRYLGTYGGVQQYHCDQASHREMAALGTFDLLKAAAQNDPAGKTYLSVSAFPAAQGSREGSVDLSNGWLATDAAESRANLEKSLATLRTPYGQTPYDQAFGAASKVFEGLPGDEKLGKLAILVTDGEPTDKDPEATAALAAGLQAKGITLSTIFVRGPYTAEQRRTAHRQLLSGFDSQQMALTSSHWWTSANVGNFDQYFDALLGTPGQLSLVERVSSRVDSNCQDSPTNKCARRILELTDASRLESVVKDVVKAYQEETCK